MRDPVNGLNYLTMRRIHQALGITIYILLKAKIYLLHRIEDHDQVLFPGLRFNLRYIYALYLIILVSVWMFLTTLLFKNASRFRHKVMQDNTGYFNTAQKSNHKKMLDLLTDGTVKKF